MSVDVLKRQRELEDSSLALGGTRFQRKLAKAKEHKQQSTVGAIKKLLTEGIEPMERTIQELIDRKGRGKRHVAVRWCKLVGADKAAFIVLKQVLDGVEGRLLVRVVASQIAGRIIDELRYRRFEEEAPGLFKYRLSKFSTTSYHHMKRSMDAAMRHAQVDTSSIDNMGSPSQRLLVGIKLIDILIQCTGLVTTESRRYLKGKNFKQSLHLVATDETAAWIEARNKVLEMRLPVALPMCCPPLPWAPGVRGGYRFALRGKYSMVKHSGHSRGFKQPNDMPDVYAGLNAAQATAWKVNQPVYELVLEIMARGEPFAGIAAFEKEELPTRPLDIDTNEEARRDWRRKAHVVHERNHMRKTKALEVSRTMSVAKRMIDVGAFWFPMNLDFRGRMYPIPAYLSPQGDDLSKGLLMFSDLHAKELGQQGAAFLAVHGANCMGECPWTAVKLDKLSLKGRVAWVRRHSEQIMEAAADPWSNSWWSEADKPLAFYAFCHEWVGYLEQGSKFKSSLPVASDGTCNGIQHFSAMLRDPVGARAVNLIPLDKPNDLYQRISDRVMERLVADAVGQELSGSIVTAEPDGSYPKRSVTDALSAVTAAESAANQKDTPELADLASSWLTSGLVDRKLCKRPTMTFGYGSKQYGFREQLVKHLREDAVDAFVTVIDDKVVDHTFEACGYMASLIWDALGDVVIAAHQAMEWMQKSSRLALGVSRSPLVWGTPTGFVIHQQYFKWDRKQIRTVLNGRLCTPATFTETDEIDRVKQVNAISPNFVHGLDAAVLVRTIAASHKVGITAFAMVHDSFATVAADSLEMGNWTREEFCRLYEENDVIMQLAADLALQSGDKEIPEAPERGGLDLNVVRESDYFFS